MSAAPGLEAQADAGRRVRTAAERLACRPV